MIPHRTVLVTSMPTSTPLRSFSDRLLANVLQFFADLCLYLPAFHYLNILAFNGPYIPVFQNLKAFRHEALRIIIRPDRTLQEATGDQGTLGDIAVSDNHLPGKGGDPVRIVIEITLHAVYQDSLVNITADQTIIIAFLVPIPVITIKTLVRQIHGPVDIGFDSGLIGSQRKEQFMHAAHMLAGLHRTVQCRILG